VAARIKGNKEVWIETGAKRVYVESEGPVVKEMAFVAYSVRDVPKAIEFYRDVIGLKPGDMVSEYWAEFDLGNTTFGIGNGESIGIIPGKSFSATFEVDDLVSTREQLLAKSVPVTEIMDAPSCTSFFVTDPEGNRFGLHQRKAKRA
jgi:predicted enzyme related to lactoylglutathione lyase